MKEVLIVSIGSFFGGKTIWGTLIDAACERYGWTFDYVVWGISYNNLTLMLKDKKIGRAHV